MIISKGLILCWWKYETLVDRLLRRKTYYFEVPDGNIKFAYQLRGNGTIITREFKSLEEKESLWPNISQ